MGVGGEKLRERKSLQATFNIVGKFIKAAHVNCGFGSSRGFQG